MFKLLVKCESPLILIVSKVINEVSLTFWIYKVPFLSPLINPVISKFFSWFLSEHEIKNNYLFFLQHLAYVKPSIVTNHC